MKNDDLYDFAKENGLTNQDRWSDAKAHHPESLKLMSFLKDHDVNDYNDYFEWKSGGDGDNGETFMFQLDAYFEALDLKNKNGS